MQKFYLILGCFGLSIDGFTCCSGLENTILDLSVNIPDYNSLINYLEQCRLFDKPAFELNAVKHIIYNIQNKYSLTVRPIWSQNKFDLYQKFVIDHRLCGVYLRLALPESLPEKSQDKSEISIKKAPVNLKLIKGRRNIK